VAQNSGGTAYGTGRSFTTSACAPSGPGPEEDILYSGFETGSNERWSLSNKASVDGVLAIGQFSLLHGKGAESVYSLSTAGYQDVSITMHLAATALGTGNDDACHAEVSTDGGNTWISVVNLQDGEDTGVFYSGTVAPPSADDNLDMILRFRSDGRRNKGYCYGDEVYVIGRLIGGG
jgi:hypothetical protein